MCSEQWHSDLPAADVGSPLPFWNILFQCAGAMICTLNVDKGGNIMG